MDRYMLWLLLIGVHGGSFRRPGNYKTICRSYDDKYICTEQNYTSIPLEIDIAIICLDLRGNMLTTISDESLTKFVLLKYLDLSNNQISFIANTSFSTLRNLQILDLSANTLTQLPQTLFKMNTMLFHLDISDNKLLQLPLDVFKTNTIIGNVNFSGNKLKYIPEDIFVKQSEPISFTCERCFDCSCLHKDTYKWIKVHVWDGTSELIGPDKPTSCYDGTLLTFELNITSCSSSDTSEDFPESNDTCVCLKTGNEVTATESFTTAQIESQKISHGNTEDATTTGIVAFCIMSALSLIIGTTTIAKILQSKIKIITILFDPKANGFEKRINVCLEDAINFSFDFEDDDEFTINTPPLDHTMKADCQRIHVKDYTIMVNSD